MLHLSQGIANDSPLLSIHLSHNDAIHTTHLLKPQLPNSLLLEARKFTIRQHHYIPFTNSIRSFQDVTNDQPNMISLNTLLLLTKQVRIH